MIGELEFGKLILCMNIDLFDYDLPERLIAQKPTILRDYANLLVMDKSTGKFSDDYFFHLDKILKSGDVLVFNQTKVIPARILFENSGKGGEILLVKKVAGSVWKAMIRPGKMFRIGSVLMVNGVEVEVLGIDQDGLRTLKFALNESDFDEFLYKCGELPVPPYIEGRDFEKSEYNTVFSRLGSSIAAPTAGLHFTEALLARLVAKGVILEFVNLNVGLGTFLPVKTRDIRDHKMHRESYSIDFGTAKRLNKYIGENKRIIAVGTTSVRVLEDNFNKFRNICQGDFETNIFINEGYQWKVTKALITNFHLPKSTLLMLVSALAGRDNVLRAYQHAIYYGYRFFSFGDAMLII